MHRATTRGSIATDRYYNSSTLLSSTTVNDGPFRFREFLGSREGQVWRVKRANTPFLVMPSPSASSAFQRYLLRYSRLSPGLGHSKLTSLPESDSVAKAV